MDTKWGSFFIGISCGILLITFLFSLTAYLLPEGYYLNNRIIFSKDYLIEKGVAKYNSKSGQFELKED